MNNRTQEPLLANLFDNSDRALVWNQATQLVVSLYPDFDFSHVRTVFDHVMELFDGTYPGYSQIKTPYHDLPHTLSVFMCAVRLAHGTHLSGNALSRDELNLIMVSAMLHDVGYAQRQQEDDGHTGAQHLRSHIDRGVTFMEQHLQQWNLPLAWEAWLSAIIRSTDLKHDLNHIPQDMPRLRLLGQIVSSSDLLGQMADRIYLEKLIYLYLEFEEAQFGDYKNMYDLLQKTRSFYETIRHALDRDLGKVYQNLSAHFQAIAGTRQNFYIEAVEKNIIYLDKIIAHHESEWLSMLKRNGIVQAALPLTRPDGA